MTHIIISSVLLVTSIGAMYLLDIATKNWQKGKEELIIIFFVLYTKKLIKEKKKALGKEMTIYPKNHSIIQRIIAISFIGSVLYLIIALLIFLFA